MDYLLLVLGGVLSGMLTSLFGLGGATTIVPILASCLFLFNIPNEYIMHFAVGTSLAVMFVNSLLATRTYIKDKDIDYKILVKFIPYIIIGSIVGAFIAYNTSSYDLMIFFVVFMVVIIVKNIVIMKKTKKNVIEDKPTTKVKIKEITIFGVISGIIGALAGGGCGIIVVTYLKSKNFKIKKSVGIAMALNVIMAVIISISFAVENASNSIHVPWSIGFIYIPVFIFLLIGSFIGVPLGKLIVKKVNDTKLSWGFLAVLICSLAVILYQILV